MILPRIIPGNRKEWIMKNRTQRTCPWWLLFTFDNPLRKWIHDPIQILQPYVHAGSTALDVGCGMGYFTLATAKLIGAEGHVYAADLQPQMLAGLRRRVERAGMLDRIQLIQTTPTSIGIEAMVDFALAFWMVHEVSQPEAFLTEIFEHLKPGGKFLLVEPIIHVSEADFKRTGDLCRKIGLVPGEKPVIRYSRAMVFTKPAG
jgi:ubiquinone/menaquinone biosynthesis C-methylase UbiE